jgi:hypothetical protein
MSLRKLRAKKQLFRFQYFKQPQISQLQKLHARKQRSQRLQQRMHLQQKVEIAQIATVVAVVVAVVVASLAQKVQQMKSQPLRAVKRALIVMELHIAAAAVAVQQEMLRVLHQVK